MADAKLFAGDLRPAQSSDTLNRARSTAAQWKILVADDEPEVHKVTRLVLSNFEFDGMAVEILSAYSGDEARRLLASHDDIALALLDVVMETDHAGLDVVRYIREDLNNHYTRIVLRTGQPGQAPEEDVIRNFDINDYKEKTELTSRKFKTLLYSTLRSYRDICTISRHRAGLERVIEATTEILKSTGIHRFASAVLAQVINLLQMKDSALYCTSIKSQSGQPARLRVLAASGEMVTRIENDDLKALPEPVRTGFERALHEKRSQHMPGCFIGYVHTELDNENLLYVEHARDLTQLDRRLLQIYATQVAVTYENLLMREEIEDTQRELVCLLCEAVERRSKETGVHVLRVALIAELLASKYRLSEDQVREIKLAAPLHDIGKVAIPDQVLNKAGKHTPDESQLMRQHANIGYHLLKQSSRPVLKLGAVIANTHHERWDGQGYPYGLSGDAIPIAGRITALADVFDALGSQRCYKEAWGATTIQHYLEEERGKQFEPKLVDLMLDNYAEFVAIRQRHPDVS